MDISCYPISIEKDPLRHQFVSEGHKGKIPKLIWYEPIHINSYTAFNLSLGDVDQHTGMARCDVISDNGDRDMILRTVCESVIILCRRYPGAYVLARGNSPARNRLYRMMISKYLTQIELHFFAYGLIGWDVEFFRRDRNYDGFMINHKQNVNFNIIPQK